MERDRAIENMSGLMLRKPSQFDDIEFRSYSFLLWQRACLLFFLFGIFVLCQGTQGIFTYATVHWFAHGAFQISNIPGVVWVKFMEIRASKLNWDYKTTQNPLEPDRYGKGRQAFLKNVASVRLGSFWFGNFPLYISIVRRTELRKYCFLFSHRVTVIYTRCHFNDNKCLSRSVRIH